VKTYTAAQMREAEAPFLAAGVPLMEWAAAALHGDNAPLVVAVDLPSGIGVDDGTVPDPTVLPANLTVTFGGCKAGLLREPAANLSGRIVVADIGLGDELERIAARDRG